MGEEEKNGVTYDPSLAVSKTQEQEDSENVFTETEAKKIEREKLIAEIDARNAKRKAEDAKTATSRKYGAGARFGGFGTSGYAGLTKAVKETSKTSTDIETPEDTTDYSGVEDKAIKRSYEDLSNQIKDLAQRVDASGNEDMIAEFNNALSAFLAGNKAAVARFSTAERRALLQERQAFMQNTVDAMLDDYMLANGKLDRVGIQARAESTVQKPGTTSKALDELKRQGPGRIDLEDIPPKDKAALSQVIATTVADAFKNITGLVEGGTTGLATATTEDASVRGYEEAATMMATDLAQSQARKDKVALMNFELEEKWKGDLVKAYSEFENRANNNERFYQSQRMQAISMEYARAFDILGLKQNMMAMENNLVSSIEGTINAERQFNIGQINRVKVANANAASQAYRSLMARDRAKYVERTKRLTGLQGMAKSASSIDIFGPWTAYADTNIQQMSQISDATLAGGNGVATAGENLGAVALNRIREMVRGGMDKRKGMIALQNIVAMGQNRMLPVNMTDEFIEALGDTVIQPSTDIKAVITNKPILKEGFMETGNSSAVFMNRAIIGSLSNTGTTYLKTAKKGKASPEEMLNYMFGE